MKVGALGSYWVGDEMVSSEAVVVKLGATLPTPSQLPAPSSAPSPFSTYCAAPLTLSAIYTMYCIALSVALSDWVKPGVAHISSAIARLLTNCHLCCIL